MPEVKSGQVCPRQVGSLEPEQVVLLEALGQMSVPELPAEPVLGPAPGGGGQQGVDHVSPGQWLLVPDGGEVVTLSVVCGHTVLSCRCPVLSCSVLSDTISCR